MRINNVSAAMGLVLAFGLACRTTSAQEIPTQQQSATLQVFGLYSYVQPHYYPSNNSGGSLGADLNLRAYYHLIPRSSSALPSRQEPT